MEKYMEFENNESYYEQVVKKKMNSDTVMGLVIGLTLITVVVIVSIILMVTVADWLFLIVLTLIPFAVYLIYYIIKNSRVEYEYTFVLGELRVARIKGRAKRRTITYFDVKAIDDVGRFIDPKTGKKTIDPSKYPNYLHAAENDNNLNTYYLIIHDKVRKQPAIITMTPNERIFTLIRPYFSVELKKKFLKMQREDEMIRSAVNKGVKAEEEKKSGEKKPEEKKSEEMKPEEKKSEEKKPEEQKSEEKKSEVKKVESDKQAPHKKPVSKSNKNKGKKK